MLVLARSGLRGLRFRHRSHSCRQPDLNDCAALGVVARRDIAAMFLHNPVADAESKASAFAALLGGIARIQDALRVFDARAVVAELCADMAVLGADSDFQGSVASGLENGVHRIV